MRGCVLIDAPHRHFIVVGGKLKYCYPGSLPRGGEAPLPAPDNNLMACVLLPAAAAFWPHEFGGAWARGGLGDDFVVVLPWRDSWRGPKTWILLWGLS